MKTIEIQGVTGSVVSHLREEIITAQLSEGAKLNENELSRQIGVSRPPIRESFRKLENENLLVSIPRKGTYITKLSVEDCQQVYYARIMIECSAVDVLKQLQITELPAVKSALIAAEKYQLLSSPSAKEMLAYLDVMSDFHKQLVEATKNNWLIHFYTSINSTLSRYQLMYLNLSGAHQFSISDHTIILNQISLGNFEKAKQHLKTHIERNANVLIRRMKSKNGYEM